MDETDALGLVELAPPSCERLFVQIEAWLARAETVGAAYQAWEALRAEYASAAQSHAQKSAALKLHGEFVLGAVQKAHVEAAGVGPTEQLAPGRARVEQSLKRLDEVSQAWEEAQCQMKRCFEEASEKVEQEVVHRIEKTLALTRPELNLTIHYIGRARCVLQFERIDELTSVLLSKLISGKVPTHYGFFFDDSVSAVDGTAQATYAEHPREGPPWPHIRKLLGDKSKLSAPWKGQIPIGCEGEVLWMLKQKGAVMEIEAVEMNEAQGSAVLEVEKAQRIVAHFFRWMGEGKIEFKLQPT